MGLFDRFKKRFKKSSKEEISVDEGSAEAKQASEVGAQMRKDIAVARDEPTPRAPVEEPDNEWDDEDDPAPDPFAAAQTDRKERKQAKRAVSVEQAKESEQPESTQSPTDPMQSTTGHKLVPTGPAKLEIDFGDTATKTCLLYTSPSPRDLSTSRMPSSA